jgi:ATP-dependent exoDNAse (exonuclease V) alpha subunit
LLADEVELVKGLKVMVTNNLATDLDITNRARGEIVDIIFDQDEPEFPDSSIVRLHKMPRCVLVKLARTRASQLDGLDEGVIPVEPMMCKMKVPMTDKTGRTWECLVIRRQFPITSAYAFTDYRSQGQTICPVMVDPATPPSGGLSLFNLYVALSRSTCRSMIRLLQDFNEQLFQKPLDTDLMLEDERLERLNRGT